MLSAALSFAQSEDVLFHDAGYSYFEKDYPTAYEKVSDGLIIYPNSDKLKELKDLICGKWNCPVDGNGGDVNGEDDECLSDSDGDGICDAVDKCPDKLGTASHRGCPDTDGDGIYDDLDRCPYEPGSRANNGCPRVEPPPPPPPRIEDINKNLSQSSSNRSVVKWNPKLASKADRLRLTFTLESYPSVTKSIVVTGRSEFKFCPEDQVWQVNRSKVILEVTIDNSKYRISGSNLSGKFFPCNCH